MEMLIEFDVPFERTNQSYQQSEKNWNITSFQSALTRRGNEFGNNKRSTGKFYKKKRVTTEYRELVDFFSLEREPLKFS